MCICRGFAGKTAPKWHINRQVSHHLCYLLLLQPQLFLFTFSHLHLGKPINNNYFLHIQNISLWHNCCWFIRKLFSQTLIWKWDHDCWFPYSTAMGQIFLKWTILFGVFFFLVSIKTGVPGFKKHTAEFFFIIWGLVFWIWLN